MWAVLKNWKKGQGWAQSSGIFILETRKSERSLLLSMVITTLWFTSGGSCEQLKLVFRLPQTTWCHHRPHTQLTSSTLVRTPTPSSSSLGWNFSHSGQHCAPLLWHSPVENKVEQHFMMPTLTRKKAHVRQVVKHLKSSVITNHSSQGFSVASDRQTYRPERMWSRFLWTCGATNDVL